MIPSLIVPTLSNTTGLIRLLESITVPVNNLVIVDNGRRWPRQGPLPEEKLHAALATCRPALVSILPMAANLGVAGSWNIGIKSTPYSSWWLIASDDVVFNDNLPDFCKAAAVNDMTIVEDNFSAFAVSERVIARIGLFDEGMHPAYWEDNEYARRMEAAGLKRTSFQRILAARSTSQTLKTCRNTNHFTFEANRARFLHNNPDPGPAEGWRLVRRRALGWDPPDQETTGDSRSAPDK